MSHRLESFSKGGLTDENKENDDLHGRGRAHAAQVPCPRRRHLDGGTHTPSGGGVLEAPSQEGGEAMRGDGCLFQRGRIWWIAYSWRGHSYKESSGSPDQREAQKLLRKRLKEVDKPHFVDPAREQRYTLDDMLEIIRLDYVRKQNRSFENVE